MRGMIDEEGYLHIERAGKMKAQMCCQGRIVTVGIVSAPGPCGDDCPLFGDPVECSMVAWETRTETRMKKPGSETVIVKICEGSLRFAKCDFEDKRPTA